MNFSINVGSTSLSAFLRKHQTHIAMQTQNTPHNVETVDIAANVMWEPITKTVHPKHN